jgi:hypothetical protein
MSLWLCLRFDALPLEALLTPQSLHNDMALVVISQRQVLICNEFAQLAGVVPGQSINTAQTLLAHQKNRFWERSPEAENILLQQLLSWAYGISPHLQQWQDNALMIEIGSCLRLHHGLNKLLRRVDAEIGLRGLTVAKGRSRNPYRGLAFESCRSVFKLPGRVASRRAHCPTAPDAIGDRVSAACDTT